MPTEAVHVRKASLDRIGRGLVSSRWQVLVKTCTRSEERIYGCRVAYFRLGGCRVGAQAAGVQVLPRSCGLARFLRGKPSGHE